MMDGSLTRFLLGTIFSLLILAPIEGSAFDAPAIQSHEEITASKRPRPTLRIQTRIGEGPWSRWRKRPLKKYHHVGALWEDANGNGTLDGDDIVIHAGPDPLHLSYLKYGAFDGRVVILKP